jgi:hypothetical protein
LVAAVANLFALAVDRCGVFGDRWLDTLVVVDGRDDVPAAMLVRRNRRGSTRIVEVAWIAVMVVPIAVRGAAANPMGVVALMLGIGVAVVAMFAFAVGGSVVAPIMFVPTLVFAMVVLVVALIVFVPAFVFAGMVLENRVRIFIRVG